MPRMLPPPARHLLVLLAFSTLLAVGCGEEQSSITGPTRPVLMTWSTLSGGMAANSSFCNDIRTGAEGAVNAVIEPQHLILRLGPGPCSSPGQAVVEAAGEVTAMLPAGNHHVVAVNTRDIDTQFSLRLRFPI